MSKHTPSENSKVDPRSQAHRNPAPAPREPDKPKPHTPGVPAQHQGTPTFPQTDRPVYLPEQVPLGGPPAQTPPNAPNTPSIDKL